jgi:calcium-dependent protein kinase
VTPQFDFCEAYELQERVLGAGGYGTVRLARCRSTSREVAVKIVPKSAPRAYRCALREAAIQEQLVHNRVCPLVDVFEDDENLYLVLEYIQGHDIFEQVLAEGAMDEAEAAAIIKQLLEALQYCHTTARVIHRDIKPENVMLTRCEAAVQCKLVDFGLAIPIDLARRAPQAVIGTELYLAPEARCGEYSPASDMWALGKVLCFMLFGGHLRNWQTAGWNRFSAEAQSFAAGLLCENASSRFTVAQAFEHPWLCARVSDT